MARLNFKAIFGAVLLTALIVLSSLFGGVCVVHAFSEYTDVVSDLTWDESFDIWAYPGNDNDNSLEVIQIAESADGELFVYVYQPSAGVHELTATCINMSLSEEAKGTQLYKLQLLSRSGVFGKYLVKGVTVSSAETRYYNITSIYRAWDKYLDKGAGNGNTVNEVVFQVGQLWTARTVDGGTEYLMLTSETIEVTTKYVGHVNYSDGANMGWNIASGSTSAHFVAFSTDKPIDKLMEADVYFVEQSVNAKICGNPVHFNHTLNGWFDYKYGDKIEHNPPLTITYKDKASNQGGNGNLNPGNKYTWDRITSTDEFLSQHSNSDYKITSEGGGSLAGTQWVLSFYETAIYASSNNVWLPLVSIVALPFVGDVDVQYTEVSEVSILRLKFETEGKVYDLGTVDNKQTGPSAPINEFIGSNTGKILFWVVVALIAVVAVVVVVCALVPAALDVIKQIFLGVGWFLTLPFRGIAALIRKIRRE